MNAKHPPNSVEAEQSVIGALLLRNESFGDVSRILTARDFYRADHQTLFAAIAEMIGARKVCDFVTLTEHLRNAGKLGDIDGGAPYIGTLASDTYSLANTLAYADIVRERALQRGLIAAAAEIGDLGYQPEGRNTAELLERAERLVFDLGSARRSQGAGPQPIGDFVVQSEAEIERLHKAGGGLKGLSTGFDWLDLKTCGLCPGDLVIVAARPAAGKTTLAVNIAEHVALNLHKRAVVFSMEMQGTQLATRLQASQSRVPTGRLRSGRLSDGDWEKLTAAGVRLRTDLLQVDETGSMSPMDVRSRVRRLAARGDLALVVVDYIQLMQVPGTRENRTNEVSNITRNLKAIAKEFGVVMIALSQLSRANEKEHRKPKLSDLRDSGGIEQDADVVLFLHRDNVGEEEETQEVAIAELILAKQRSGPTGHTFLNFYGAVSRFEDMTPGEVAAHRNAQRARVLEPVRRGFDAKRAAGADA